MNLKPLALQLFLRRMRWVLLWLVVAPGVPFVLISAAIIGFANWPGDPGLQEPAPLEPGVGQLTLVTHGKGDGAQGWVAEMVDLLRQRSEPGEGVRGIDWSRGAKNLFRCSRNAEVAGRRLAAWVGEQGPQLTEVNLVAHSAGAFLAYGFCRQLKAQYPDIRVQVTYLDPAGVYRGLWWDYGYRHFGRCADSSTTIYHVGDGAPGSEAPPQHGAAIDITALRPADDPDGHLWPVRYYMERLRAQPAP